MKLLKWLWIAAAIIWLIVALLVIFVPKAEGQEFETPIDKELVQDLIGVWKETYTQGCITGESLIVYYPDMTFEEHGTYIATEDCTLIAGRNLETGETFCDVRSGKWIVSYGYIHYKGSDNLTSKIRIISIGDDKVSYEWDNGEKCEGYRVNP